MLELVYFKFLSKLIDKNLLIWNNIDLGLYLYNFGESIYFNHILAEIIICTVTPIVLILLHLSSKYSEYLYQCTDGFSRGYSAFAGLMRFFRLIWYFLHDGWIIFLLISILSNHLDIWKCPLGWIYTGINVLYLIYQLIKILCFTKKTTVQIGDVLPQRTISSQYYVIDEGKDYIFVKNIVLETPIFYLMKSKTKSSPIKFSVLDYSTNYSEIASEFDRRVNNSKDCFDVEIPERERPIRSEHENY